MNMWADIKLKIYLLKSRDPSKEVFGADTHLYEFGESLSETQIQAWETDNGAALPPKLRSYYLELGNGGPGPFYGLLSLKSLKLYNPSQPFQTPETLKALAIANQTEDTGNWDYCYEDDDFWWVPDDKMTGMITVISYGCGHEICMATNGPHIGKLFFLSCDKTLYSHGGFMDTFHNWLDSELA